MKRLIAFISAIALLITLASCGSTSNVDINSLKENMISVAKDLPNMKTVTSGDENADTVFKSMSDLDYGKVDSYFLSYSADGSPYEIAAVTVKNSGDVNDFEASLREHIDSRISLYEDYAPEYVKAAQKAEEEAKAAGEAANAEAAGEPEEAPCEKTEREPGAGEE